MPLENWYSVHLPEPSWGIYGNSGEMQVSKLMLNIPGVDRNQEESSNMCYTVMKPILWNNSKMAGLQFTRHLPLGQSITRQS